MIRLFPVLIFKLFIIKISKNLVILIINSSSGNSQI